MASKLECMQGLLDNGHWMTTNCFLAWLNILVLNFEFQKTMFRIMFEMFLRRSASKIEMAKQKPICLFPARSRHPWRVQVNFH